LSEGGAGVGRRRWIAVSLVIGALHVAVLAFLGPGSPNPILETHFQPEAEAVLDGVKPYAGVDFEYPPLALPVLLAPAAVSDSPGGYRQAFGWEMIGFDLAIVALLAFAFAASHRRRLEALAIYSAGVITLSVANLTHPDAILSIPLPLARFDLAPASLVLAAVLARRASRAATWSMLLSAATAVKAFPLLLAPALLRGERELGRIAVAAMIPIGIAAALVVGFGDDFSSAISYHSGRSLQFEAVAGTPLLLADKLGVAEAQVRFGSGSHNLVGSGADAARLITLALAAAGYLLLTAYAWRRRAGLLETATAVLALAVVFAPVLSPQFLLWVLPVSAAAFGLGIENLCLLLAVILTRVMFDNYDSAPALGDAFVWPSAARNALLLIYVALVIRALCDSAVRRPNAVTAPT
jgi:hypothetical protein